MSTQKTKKPVVIDLEGKGTAKAKKRPDPADAPPILDVLPQGETMQSVTRFAAKKPSKFLRVFIYSVISLFGFMISIAFWDFITEMFTRNIWLGRTGLALLGISVLCALVFVFKELQAFSRLRRMDKLHRISEQLWADGNREKAQNHAQNLAGLLSNKTELAWALAGFKEHQQEMLDAPAILEHAEKKLIKPLDDMAQKEIEITARQVATATALVPMALLDVAFALVANVRMIRKIAEIYGGRAGSFGSWRLLKSVAGHLVATGAVALGDDMIGSIAGGGVLSKVSRRFGEGMVNSALTARVGIAAMEVCRPMPFKTISKPRVTGVVKNALTGFINQDNNQ